MSAASYQSLSDRRRLLGFLLALAVEALIIIGLLLWSPYLTPKAKPDRALTTFSLSPAPDKEAAKKETAQAKQKTKVVTTSAAAAAAPPITPIPVKPPVPAPPTKVAGMIPMNLGTSDIGNIKGSGDTGNGKDSSLAYGPGEGPGGMPLYKAEWYREPTNAELNGYVKKMPEGGGWALIACRTIAGYHVENCQSLGESPAGSGLARDMRLAAWQFLVRPPRRGGKALVGAWVSIRIDFHVTTIRQSMAGRSTEGLKLPPEPKPRYAPADPPSGDELPSGGFSLPPSTKPKYGPANGTPRGDDQSNNYR
jgi:protein TonB